MTSIFSKRGFNGGVQTRFFGEIDYRPTLRGGTECPARIVNKQFSGDAGFGDCAMFIEYEFVTTDNETVLGRFEATQSSFFQVKVGDTILVRYDPKHAFRNAPTDALCIINKSSPDE